MTQIAIRATKGSAKTVPSLQQCLDAKRGERVLFVCPHDDDAAIGAGMLLAQAAAEGFEVHIGVTTDGRMGYCTADQRDTITSIRKAETLASYKLLGVPAERIHFLGFPDGALYSYIGRRKAVAGDPDVTGYTGMQNSFTWLLRKVQPQRLFTPAQTDLHPDHQAVYKDLMISIYHAAGDIWPELGTPCEVPTVYDYPIYVALDGPPDYMLTGDAALFERKLRSIAAYVSQKQIKATVDGIREAGAVEFFRNLKFSFYRPALYKELF